MNSRKIKARANRETGDSLRLKHAISPPSFGKGKLHRARLVDSLLGDLDKKLIVIAAPAGYGKTTLLADFSAHARLAVCWVRLYEGLQDAVDIASLLHLSLARRFRRIRPKLPKKSYSGLAPAQMARVAATIIESEIDQPFVIAIDDAHIANGSKDILGVLDALLEALPEHVTVIAAGREPLSVSLAKLMANGDLAGLGPQELALTRSELRELLARRVRATDRDPLIDSLLEETRGWITGVLLSKEVGRETGVRAAFDQKPMVYQYLASVVMGRLSDNVRTFMMESAILRVMTPEKCDRLLGIAQSGTHLSKLAREGLFVTASEVGPRTYEFHPLFRGYLLSEFETTNPRKLAKLRLRAAHLAEDSGAAEEAFALFVEGNDATGARRVAERIARGLHTQGRMNTLESWALGLRSLGAPSITLLRLLATSYLDRGRVEDAEAVLSEIEKTMTRTMPIVVRGAVENLRGMVAYRKGDYAEMVRAVGRAETFLRRGKDRFLHLGMSKRLRAQASSTEVGDIGRAEKLGLEAVAYLERAGEPYSLAAGLIDLCGYQLQAGKQAEAWQAITRANRILTRIGGPLPLAICAMNIGLILHQRGRYEEAISRLQEGEALARGSGSILLQAHVAFLLADLFSDLGLYEQSGRFFERALETAATTGDLELIGSCCVRTSALHRRAGNMKLAQGWLSRSLEFTGKLERLGLAVSVQQAALAIRRSPREAGDTLAAIVGGGDARPDASDLTLATFLESYARHVAGDHSTSSTLLAEALTMAVGTGTEQAIAGELHCDDAMDEFFGNARPNPSLARTIVERVQVMRTIRERHDTSPPAKEERVGQLEVAALGRGSIKFGGLRLGKLKPLHNDILFYLVDCSRADKDQLTNEFWPELAPGRQAANLHMAVYSLRKELGKDNVVFEGGAYALSDSMEIDYDVRRFEKSAAAANGLGVGDPRKFFALTEAISCFRGQFLETVGQPWVVARRHSLDKLFLELAASFSDEAMRRGSFQLAEETLAKALRIDPFGDSLNTRYLEALAGLGRRSEVVSHYLSYVKALGEELGLDPAPEVSSLYSRLIG